MGIARRIANRILNYCSTCGGCPMAGLSNIRVRTEQGTNTCVEQDLTKQGEKSQ